MSSWTYHRRFGRTLRVRQDEHDNFCFREEELPLGCSELVAIGDISPATGTWGHASCRPWNQVDLSSSVNIVREFLSYSIIIIVRTASLSKNKREGLCNIAQCARHPAAWWYTHYENRLPCVARTSSDSINRGYVTLLPPGTAFRLLVPHKNRMLLPITDTKMEQKDSIRRDAMVRSGICRCTYAVLPDGNRCWPCCLYRQK